MATAQMANGKADKNGKSKGKFDFTPTDFDRDSLPPACPAGEWTAKLVSAKVGPTKIKPDGTGGYPMVTCEFKLTGTDNDENENFVGSKHRAYLVMPPKGAKGERVMKLTMRAFCQNFDIELDTLPTGRITKTSQFNDFLAAIKGVEGTIWTVIQDNNGEEQTALQFRAPGSAGAAKGAVKGKKAVEEEDEEEDLEEEDEEETTDEEEEEEEEEEEDLDEDEEPPVVRGKKGNVAPIAAAAKRGPGRPRKQA
jgi:hypothetical protein